MGYLPVSQILRRDDVLAMQEMFTEFIRHHYCGECEVCRKLAKIAEGRVDAPVPKESKTYPTGDTY